MAKKLNKAALALSATMVPLTFTVADHAQAQTSTGTASASAVVVTAVSISGTSILNFGEFTVDGSSGTVVVDATGTRTSTGGVTELGTSESAGSLTVSGANGLPIDISMTGTANIATGTGTAAESMVVNTFVLENATGTNLATDTVTLTAGSTNVGFGASLVVPDGQAAGTYTGTFSVFASYQ